MVMFFFCRALFRSRELVEDNPRIGRDDLDAVCWLRHCLRCRHNFCALANSRRKNFNEIWHRYWTVVSAGYRALLFQLTVLCTCD